MLNKNMSKRAVRFLASACCVLIPSVAMSSGDFPLASCKSWNGTITGMSGVGSTFATMTGVVTKADIKEYCRRDPGGETVKYGGKLSINSCIRKYMAETGGVELISTANCKTGALSFKHGKNAAVRASFPLSQDDDVSCASDMPPLIAQFKLLCPASPTECQDDGKCR